MRQRTLLALAALLMLLLPAGAASANSKQFTTVEAPAELLSGAPGAALDEIASLGADGVRLQIPWRGLALDPEARSKPSFNATDPDAYPAGAWARYDAAVEGARERGLKVHLTVGGPAPTWATPRGRDSEGLLRPDASEFGKFATAVGRRYRSLVSWWSIWNEPNLGKFLKPIARNRSAAVYRDLYVRAYSGLRSAGVRTPVLFGELAPIGNSIKGIGTIPPLRFLRGVLCLDKRYKSIKRKRCAKLPTQGIAMHPYSQQAGPFLQHANKDNVTIGVLDRLTKALDRAARAGAVRRRLPVYVTEFGVQSFPDKRVGVPLSVQSDYRSVSERIAYANRRVKSFSQYLLVDDESEGREYGRFESGLYLHKGPKAKPALEGFRLPLVVVPGRGSRAQLWGLVRPGKQARRGGRVTIQYKDGRRRWKRLGVKRYGRSGYWKRAVRDRRNRVWRVVWKAPDGTRHVGPATQAWARPWTRGRR